MKKACCLLLALILVLGTLQAFAAGVSDIMRVVNCKQWVSLREEPDSLSDRLLKVPKGAVVEAYAYDDTWFACEYKGEFGYILSYYLD